MMPQRRAPRATRASSRPQNLEGQVGAGSGEPAQDADAPAKGTEGYQSIFAPQNLEGQVGAGSGEPDRKEKE